MSNRPYSMRSGSGGGPTSASKNIDVSNIIFGDKIDHRLFSDIAKAAAEEVGSNCEGDQNKPTQLRRFYEELLNLQTQVGANAERFVQYRPFIEMLKAKVAYANGRKKVDGRFATLLRHVVDQAQDAGRLKQARLFMEAFMAFYKVHGPKD